MRFSSLKKKLLPPPQWRRPVIILLGIGAGLAIYIAHIANVGSYLTDDPTACVNCHVMTPQFITWRHSSHREVATCNDCHVPQDNFIKKYFFKAKDGLYHSTIFTLRKEPQAIVMHEAGQEAVQSNCIRCHISQVTDPRTAAGVSNHAENRLDRTCWSCHRNVPHGRERSLSSVGFHLEPLPVATRKGSFVPAWLDAQVNHTSN
ncbi:MAG TPA: cytochrome c nitrite reductase small subunit [Calditrichia bacterium]|nr:cytochrome c nitrite reductase small subunit [Calditrichota bacterium]HQU70822.1 cytochrome c nitrite reductase small subunit [Calditrichia bacterium]HQV31168.1 cytochrome c nitrite reductase small subunit [Calditrichia bacterium]